MALRDCVAWVETRVAVSLWIAALFGTVVSIVAACVCLPHPAAVLWLCLQVRFPSRAALLVVPGVQAYFGQVTQRPVTGRPCLHPRPRGTACAGALAHQMVCTARLGLFSTQSCV